LKHTLPSVRAYDRIIDMSAIQATNALKFHIAAFFSSENPSITTVPPHRVHDMESSIILLSFSEKRSPAMILYKDR
jgi:hypothetical protein